MSKQWKVRVEGLVTRPEGNRRVVVDIGDYIMQEAGPLSSDYDLISDVHPVFTLTLQEVAQYRSDNSLKIDGDWP
jgi:hypothetical protein